MGQLVMKMGIPFYLKVPSEVLKYAVTFFMVPIFLRVHD
jgi:hypothetical protein